MRGRALVAVAAFALASASCSDDDAAVADPTTPTTAAQADGPITDDGRSDPFTFAEDVYAGDEGPTVVIIGDSIVDGSRVALHRALADSYRVAIAGAIGEGWPGGLITDELGVHIAPALAELYAPMDPDIVVLALGTNDAWKPELDAAAGVDVLRSVAGSFDGGCIVGVEVYDGITAEGFDPREAALVNDALADVADELVDISELAATDRFEPDHVHPLPEAFDDYAALVADGVARCTLDG